MNDRPGYPWSEGDALFASELNAAIANNISGPFLPLAGGTVSGPVTFEGNVTTPGTVPPVLATTWHVTNTGGTTASFQAMTDNVTYINAAAGQNIWANRDQLFYTAPLPGSTSNNSYVARTIHTVAYTDRGPGVGLWGLIVDLDDETGHASSVAGGLLSVEIDICAGGLDDANSRQGLAIVGFTRNYPTVTTSQFNNGISVWTGDAGASFKHLVSFGAPFSGAGIDFTQSTSIGNAPAIWLKTGQSISLDSGPFMQLKAGAGGTAEFQWLGVRVWGVDPNGIMAAASVGVGGTTGPCWTTGAAAPAATQPVGSIYSRVGGAVGATLYVSRGGGTWAAVAGV